MKKILSLMMCIVLLVGTIGFVSAMSPESYNELSFFEKVRYGISSGDLFGLFSTWGQANDCSVYPDKKKILKGGDRIDCDDYCSYDKCAIDYWYDKIGYLGSASPSYSASNPNWNVLVGGYEKNGDGAYFRASTSHDYWYVEVYCCPRDVPVISDHSTRAYVCEAGSWDYKSRYDSEEYCRYDTTGGDLCWCSDETDRFYVDDSGNVHCRGSARSSWCGSYVAHDSKKCTSAGKLYWYDSRGDINDLIETCSSNEKCTTSGCVIDLTPPSGAGGWDYCSSTNKCSEGEGDCDFLGTDRQCKTGLTCVSNVGAKYGWDSSTDVCEKAGGVADECTAGQEKCVGTGTTSNQLVVCVDGKWGVVGGVGYANCISGRICTVGGRGSNVCYIAPVTCDNDGICESAQGENTVNCYSDCCALGDTTCSTQNFYKCVSGNWQNQGKVSGQCGYTDSTGLGTWNYCSSTNKCSEGEGDCDGLGTDNQCLSGLTCVSNVGANYGWDSSTDVCEKADGVTSHASKKCYSNDVYWYNSQGTREEKYKDCGTVGCVSGSSSCRSALTCNPEGNSCGGPSNLQSGQSCCTGSDCQNFQCVKTGSCSSGQTKCGIVGDQDVSGEVYYTCVSGTFKSQGKVVGKCGYSECQSGADSDGNGQINRNELDSQVSKWLDGQVTRTGLGQTIQEWSSGC